MFKLQNLNKPGLYCLTFSFKLLLTALEFAWVDFCTFKAINERTENSLRAPIVFICKINKYVFETPIVTVDYFTNILWLKYNNS